MTDNIFRQNRIILCHFDTYSTALLFARQGTSVLLPEPLPEEASALAEPPSVAPQYNPDEVLLACFERYGLDASNLRPVADFQEWMDSSSGPVRVHLAQFTTLDAPHEAMQPHDVVFKPISQMRGTPMIELNLLRRAFNLFTGNLAHRHHSESRD
jgi:hypothetical protein